MALPFTDRLRDLQQRSAETDQLATEALTDLRAATAAAVAAADRMLSEIERQAALAPAWEE